MKEIFCIFVGGAVFLAGFGFAYLPSAPLVRKLQMLKRAEIGLQSTLPSLVEYFGVGTIKCAHARYIDSNFYTCMKKSISDFKVLDNVCLTDRLFLLKLTPADGKPMEACKPGQFVEVRVDQEPSVFLRRPISIHRVLKDKNEMWLLVQKAGNGTQKLSTLKQGDLLNLVYPLGNGYCLEGASAQKFLLVGGGVGIAPLLETGAVLKEMGAQVTFLLGGRSAKDLVEVDEYKAVGEVLVTTEDGTVLPGLDCQKGFVTNHSRLQEGAFDAIRVCGPGPMMKAVAKVVSAWKQNEAPHFCEVSLENKMACGLGVCLCCVEDTKEGHKCVCSEGPVFDTKDLKW